ncbi:hypothetical protein O181_132232 [Austropuccinia psidii MF-1]|uniref:Uncharacterized protein n=1 Tax=Austropuccinia psidii MF-1 TaxID=1389203 RepID=A0A9Q3L6Z7_9BASI|nr:hypothetical protein [Austropuccinia psidii MF-1]
MGQPNTCKLLNGWHPLMEKKNIIFLTAEWRENDPPPPKQVPKTAPTASSSNFNVKRSHKLRTRERARHQLQSLTARAAESPNVQQDTMENVFQMARTIMELNTKGEARLKYQK